MCTRKWWLIADLSVEACNNIQSDTLKIPKVTLSNSWFIEIKVFGLQRANYRETGERLIFWMYLVTDFILGRYRVIF